MTIIRWLGRLAAVVMLAGLAALVTFVIVFLYGESPRWLAWAPALAFTSSAAGGLLLDWRRKGPGRRAVDVLAAVAFVVVAAGAAGTVTGWFATEPSAIVTNGMAAEGFIPTRDGTIYFHQSAPAGSPRPVLLVLHGGPGSGSVVLRHALGDELDARFRTVFFDQRGVGRSSAVSSFAIGDVGRPHRQPANHRLDSRADDGLLYRRRRSGGCELVPDPRGAVNAVHTCADAPRHERGEPGATQDRGLA